MADGIAAFIGYWERTGGSERANKDKYLIELCDVLDVDPPEGKTGDPDQDVYVFEADVPSEVSKQHRSIDLYKKGHFVLEAKQGSVKKGKKLGIARRGTPRWASAMNAALDQAMGYAQKLDERPPFLIVLDIGYCLDLFACFDGSGAYRPYPNGQNNRLYLKDLRNHVKVLRAIWLDPHSLDLTHRSEQVTREVAADLAKLAAQLEVKHPSEKVTAFLMRCIFTMFAQDVGLLRSKVVRDKVFTTTLEETWLPDPVAFKEDVERLWDAMNKGRRYPLLGKLLRFNGGLFADPTALPLNKGQLKILLRASKHDWSKVEPAIFGTLIERALDSRKRRKLGAHFTPTAHVNRLLAPTIEEPLRAEWDAVRTEVHGLVPPDRTVRKDRIAKARRTVHAFHKRLCRVVVLDPACGSGNFLYLALSLFKRLESEVLATLDDLGGTTKRRVLPKQFRGIEIRPESKEIAELVLWIGYLQWHYEMYGRTKPPPEPILRDYRNVECRDAILAYGRRVGGTTRWDGHTTKVDHITGKDVPDETATLPAHAYLDARPATWPRADFIVGNPPFVGTRKMRLALGDGYVDALQQAIPVVPENADFVMYWWDKGARLVRAGEVQRFGFITTNSISQTFNRAALHPHLDTDQDPLTLSFVIPDHPWVNSSDGAAIRVAMTVGSREAAPHGRLIKVKGGKGQHAVLGAPLIGRITEDLRIGASPATAVALQANAKVAYWGVKFYGAGFIVTPEQAEMLEAEDGCSLARPFVGGQDLTGKPRGLMVLDCNGLDEQTLQEHHPAAYQWLVERVKPERRHNPRAFKRERWWIFGENQPGMRKALQGCKRYIATTETAKHRVFHLFAQSMVPEGTVAVITSSDPYILGVLSSRIHTTWALASGARLGVGNDPRYNKTRCFDPFPFPVCSSAQRDRIAAIATKIDRLRRRQQQRHPDLTTTTVYNVLDALRSSTLLTDKQREVNRKGLVSTLLGLHQDLDKAVSKAYGWPANLGDDEVVDRVVLLNRERAEEEANGNVRWLLHQ
jgi:hypothetical protein